MFAIPIIRPALRGSSGLRFIFLSLALTRFCYNLLTENEGDVKTEVIPQFAVSSILNGTTTEVLFSPKKESLKAVHMSK